MEHLGCDDVVIGAWSLELVISRESMQQDT